MWGPYSPALKHNKEKALHETYRCLAEKKNGTEEMPSRNMLQLSHKQQLCNNGSLQQRFTEAK